VGITSVVVLIGLGTGMKQNLIKSYSATNNIINVVPGPDYRNQISTQNTNTSQNTGVPYEVIS
jgi:hypothetical protein